MRLAQNKIQDDLLRQMDDRFPDERARWNRFFSSLKSSHPLATSLPDEHLVEALRTGIIKGGRALDIGCGNGRNAIFLAKQGFEVHANDISEEALRKTNSAAEAAGVKINFILGPFFEIDEVDEMKAISGNFDLIYDFGCLHHIHPHRRPQYIDFVSRFLRPNGILALGSFNEKMGIVESDAEIMKDFDLKGGICFSPERLRSFFDPSFNLLDMREMRNISSDNAGIGWDHMRVSFWARKER